MRYHELETAPRSEIRALQDRRVREAVARAHDVAFYRRRLDDAGVSPGDVESVDDLRSLPFTTKEDFRAEYPDGLFAAPRDELRRIHASSGTTGKPKVVGYTAADLDRWVDLAARSLYAAGVRPGERVQNAAGYGLFTGGLGWHYGVERLGAGVVPAGAGNTRRQIELIADLDADALVTLPSYALYLAEQAREAGRNPADLGLGSILVGAEPSTRETRATIGREYDATVTENYGLSELLGPGMATECATARDGMHLWEDHFYPEVIDPETGEVLGEGERGELVLTALTREALPLLRYRTGDVTAITYDPCECGRTHARLDGITGRTDDLLIVRGVNVYPTEVESVLGEFGDLAPHYRIDLHRRAGGLDEMEVTVERGPDADLGDTADLEERLTARLTEVLGLTPDEVTVVAHRALDRTEGKAKRVYDHRD
ncbi:phenylacetate--CoA ligase [Halobacteriales archaeon QS_8_69_26]|nr:MAG: phenylacetate--CoA ligase [Halobacteriales archaeon QS_8_69_26]